LNLVDSCGWLEFLADGPNASDYARVLTDPKGPQALLLPSICLQEVFKVTLRERGRAKADTVAAFLRSRARIVPHDAGLALEAANLGQRCRLALADSIVYATARLNRATLWTQDRAFRGLSGVHFVARKPR
jgi:toxin FitB